VCWHSRALRNPRAVNEFSALRDCGASPLAQVTCRSRCPAAELPTYSWIIDIIRYRASSMRQTQTEPLPYVRTRTSSTRTITSSCWCTGGSIEFAILNGFPGLHSQGVRFQDELLVFSIQLSVSGISQVRQPFDSRCRWEC
jgi:hypothetical protein